jgi:hypothetical protein
MRSSEFRAWTSVLETSTELVRGWAWNLPAGGRQDSEARATQAQAGYKQVSLVSDWTPAESRADSDAEESVQTQTLTEVTVTRSRNSS